MHVCYAAQLTQSLTKVYRTCFFLSWERRECLMVRVFPTCVQLMDLSLTLETYLTVGGSLKSSAIITHPPSVYALLNIANHMVNSVLLARDETDDEQIRDSNLGLSSMLLYHATVIIHGKWKVRSSLRRSARPG